MRLFGILLVLFNIAAAAAFVYLSTQNWKGRQTITAAGLRHMLLLQGLPLDGPEQVTEPATGESVPKVGEEVTGIFSINGKEQKAKITKVTPQPDGTVVLEAVEPTLNLTTEIVVPGQPKETIDFAMDMAGGTPVKTISYKLLNSYFETNAKDATPLGTGVVANQVAEVRRVKSVIAAQLKAKEKEPKEQIDLLKGWLLNQAETIDVRVSYQALISPVDANGVDKTPERLTADATKLREILDARFAAVLAKPARTENAVDPGEKNDPGFAEKKAKIDAMPDKDRLAKSAEWRGAVQDDTQRRMMIAHLLVHLDPDANWQKRVAVVVGLRRYVKALSVQVVRFADMVNQIERYIPNDQAAFTKHENQLRDQAIRYAERARAVAEIRSALNAQKVAKDDAVSRHRTQLKALTDQLTKIKNEVDEKLVRQTEIETDLFETQREVALTLEEVYRLEALLAAVERERYGLPPVQKP
ncbi:MAG: hypothetical protein FJ304_22315 [Planctomycetes bacterium]|nr:hypothetical protein [Planctomycetota bacterium]